MTNKDWWIIWATNGFLVVFAILAASMELVVLTMLAVAAIFAITILAMRRMEGPNGASGSLSIEVKEALGHRASPYFCAENIARAGERHDPNRWEKLLARLEKLDIILPDASQKDEVEHILQGEFTPRELTQSEKIEQDYRRWLAEAPLRAKPLVAVRAPIYGTDLLRDGQSWFGGLPRLGNKDWPTNEFGKPLYHFATLDLKEISAFETGVDLPKSGKLSFFMEFLMELEFQDRSYDSKVIYTPETDLPETPPPENLFQCKMFNFFFDNNESPFGTGVFPRWPINFYLKDSEDYNQLKEDKNKYRASPLSKEFLTEKTGSPFICWKAVQKLSHQVSYIAANIDQSIETKSTLFEKYSSNSSEQQIEQRKFELDAMRATAPNFKSFAKQFESWCVRKPSTDFLNESEVTKLNEIVRDLRKPYSLGELNEQDQQYHLFDIDHHGVEREREKYLVELIQRGEFQKLVPEEVLKEIDNHLLLKEHRIFGKNVISDSTSEFSQNAFMLLSIEHDEFISMPFGDHNDLCFFIHPKDLAQRNWDKAFGLF